MKDVYDFKGIINVGNGNYSYDLTFGFNSKSNDEYNKEIDRYAPPQPPPVFFDAALNSKGERYYSKILKFDKHMEYIVMLQYCKNNIINIKWDNSGWDNSLSLCVLCDINDNNSFYVNMLTEDSVVIKDNTITQLKLLINSK